MAHARRDTSRCLRTGRCAGLALALGLCGVAAPAGAQSVLFEGKLIDPEQKLVRALRLSGGCGDLQGGGRERITNYLDDLGYRVERVACVGGRVVIRVRPHRVIRKIYIKGNWPLFEEEILRRLRFRPGQRLPGGEQLARAIARQEQRMKRYLSKEGYFDGSLSIKITPTSTPHQVNLQVRVLKGKRYKVGEIVTTRPARDRSRVRQAGLAVPRDEIEKMFRHRILFFRRSFNTRTFDRDAQRLTRRFHDLGYPGMRLRKSYEVVEGRPPDSAVRIKLRIQQRKKIEVHYRGNHSVKDDDLDEVLTLYDEGVYDDYELTQSAQEIHRLYQSRGHLQARVRFSRKVGRTVDQVYFHIHEGPRFRIRRVEFAGNKQIDADRLQEVVKTRPFPWLGLFGLGEGGYITGKQLRQDVARLTQYYREQGFPQASVRGEVVPHPDLAGRPGALAAAVGAGATGGGDLYVRFTIDEGKRSMVEKVYISGNRLVDSRTLLGQLALKAGRPFTVKALELDKARLARIYGEKGHPYAEIRALEESDLDGTNVVVQFTVQENQPVRFGPIFVRGNFHTRRSVIMADLDFKPGDPFDVALIERAERKLRKRQIFDVVRIQLLGIGRRQPELPVLVAVEERYDDYGAIEVGVGGSTDNLLFGSLAYNNRNVLGFGTSVTLKGEAGMKIQNVTAQYRDARIFGSPVVLDLRGFVRNQITARLGEVLTYGGTLGFQWEFLPHLTGILNYEIRRTKIKDELNRPSGVEDARQADVFTRTGGIGHALVYDRRDNPLNPSKGYRLQGSALMATRYLGGTNDFLKLGLSAQGYIPLPLGMTIALSVRYDHALPFGDSVTLPKVERFYAGGDTTIRGLDEDAAWTEVIGAPLAPGGATSYRIRPQGGNIRLIVNAEFIFPIWDESILFGLPLKGAVFTDHGFVTNSFDGFEGEDFRHSVGLAWRLVTPVGFFSVAFPAFVIDKEVGDERWRVHFNFGFVF